MRQNNTRDEKTPDLTSERNFYGRISIIRLNSIDYQNNYNTDSLSSFLSPIKL